MSGNSLERFEGKNVRDLTDEELYEILDRNVEVPNPALTYVCSEVLRRQVVGYKNIPTEMKKN